MQAQKLVVFDDKDQWLHAVIHIGKTNEGLEVSLARGTGWTITEAAQKAPRERGFARARAIGALEQGRKDSRAQAVKHDQRRVVPSGRNLFLAALFLSDDGRVHVAQLRRYLSRWRDRRRVGKQPDEQLRSSIAKPFFD